MSAEPTQEERERAKALFDYICTEVFSAAERQGALRAEPGAPKPWKGHDVSIVYASLANVWENITSVPQGSALEAFLVGRSSADTGASDAVVMPFHSNLDQRNAIRAALTHQISIIDGPPGTGKTQTILNLIATLVAQGKTVGVVASANSAVENVVKKLSDEGYGFLIANLGSAPRVRKFHSRQDELIQQRKQWCDNTGRVTAGLVIADELETLREEEERLVDLWKTSRDLPIVRAQLDNIRHERKLFEEKVKESRRSLPDMGNLPIASAPSETIAELVAAARFAPRPSWSIGGLIERVRRYRTFGPLKGLDLRDVDVQSAIQMLFYRAREAELAQAVDIATQRVEDSGVDDASAAYRRRSRSIFDAILARRFCQAGAVVPDLGGQIHTKTQALLSAYPIVASSCYSIGNNLGRDPLLDWVIVDEASQVLLPPGLAALSVARNAVIVGDTKQLSPIFAGWCESESDPPDARVDVRSLSLLESAKEMEPDSGVVSTLLKEHYRCHPAIIEFCNRMYYDGQLIPMRSADEGAPSPFKIVHAAPGNHARRLEEGGSYSQREIDIIARIITQLEDMKLIRKGIQPEDKDGVGDFLLGIVTPFRVQAQSAGEQVLHDVGEGSSDRWMSATVHKFQGRDAETIILSTVLNSTDKSAGFSFYDADAMTNVSVSRAKDRLIVVTAHNGVPHSKNVSALLDYIKMYDPRVSVESDIVSIFDVLYSAYSASLERYSRAKWSNWKRTPAENVADLCLREVLADRKYSSFGYYTEVPLREALPHTRFLNEEQRDFVFTDSALDFGVYSRVTGRIVLAIEVDGWEYHGNNKEQQQRDARKDSIMAAYGVPVLRLATNESGEERRIKEELDKLL
ncbi:MULTISPECIES: AAA domain-containing protein [Actinomycetaceae]|uniref:AAA domain-containing protein n=1 Tax=Actinomycetaceae TaxID=2049 RepID=UPI000396CA19|nr:MULTISPECIES: AAA domain-containing protein [Actinomycetaceae]ERH32838.1 hypothetical protein HMPREF1980_00218 [Actinomyces sp. oral taxon 172 str. F0311]WLD77528.1 AAA domain-containing protein [Schaalia sp. HMT-172]